MPEQPAYVLVKARALRELTEAVNAANLDVAKLHHRLTADGCYVPDHPLHEPLTLHGPLSWTDDLAEAFQAPQGDRESEGFSNPRVASSRKVRSAVMALQFALGVVEDGIVGPATMQAIEGIRAGGEDERVLVRAVSPAYPGPDRDTWALDPDATGHRAPFAAGDLVVRSSGREGIHQVLEVSVDGDAPRHRSLRLKVEPTDVVVDRDAIWGDDLRPPRPLRGPADLRARGPLRMGPHQREMLLGTRPWTYTPNVASIAECLRERGMQVGIDGVGVGRIAYPDLPPDDPLLPAMLAQWGIDVPGESVLSLHGPVEEVGPVPIFRGCVFGYVEHEDGERRHGLNHAAWVVGRMDVRRTQRADPPLGWMWAGQPVTRFGGVRGTRVRARNTAREISAALPDWEEYRAWEARWLAAQAEATRVPDEGHLEEDESVAGVTL